MGGLFAWTTPRDPVEQTTACMAWYHSDTSVVAAGCMYACMPHQLIPPSPSVSPVFSPPWQASYRLEWGDFSNYKLFRNKKVGEGAYGSVFLAMNRTSKEHCVVKTVRLC